MFSPPLAGRASSSWTWLLTLCLLWVGPVLTAIAQEPLPAFPRKVALAWVEDRSGVLTIEDVAALPSERFSRGTTLSAGYTRSVYWVRIATPPTWLASVQWLEVRPPFLDRLDVYEADGRGWRVQRLGDTRPRSDRLVDYRNIVVPIQAASGRHFPDVYLRVQTTSALLLDVQRWTPETFAEQATRETTLWGIYFGVAALSVLLTAGLTLVTRSRKLWALLAFSVAYVLVASNQGFMGWLVLPNAPHIAHLLPGLSVMLGQAATLWLIQESLDFREHLPRLNRVFSGLIVLMLLASLSVPLDFYTEISAPALVLIEASKWIAVVAGFVLWRRHGRMYGWITAAFGLHVLSILLTALTLSGVLPLNLWLLQAWQYGLVLLMLMVAGVSLVQVRQDHLRRLADKTDALLATEQARALLAQRVADRTHELELTRDQLAQALRDEQEAHFQQRQLVGMVSHEFRTPLAVIDLVLNNLQLIPPETLEEMQMRLAQIRDANRHLVQLTDTCLADARLGAGLLSLVRPETLDLPELLHSTLDMLYGSEDTPLGTTSRPVVDTSSIQSVGRPLTVWGDAGLLRIALCNVLENARKYAGADHIHLSLHGGHEPSPRVQLRVRDQGPGIAIEDRERVFERFARGDHMGRARGNGLGLFISREIMRTHSGDLRLLADNADVGHTTGCVFEFEWPLHSPNHPPHED